MTFFNPHWGGVDYVQDTPPQDNLVISYTPSIASDSLAAAAQLDSESSAKSFMQAQFRMDAENMRGAGLVYSSAV